MPPSCSLLTTQYPRPVLSTNLPPAACIFFTARTTAGWGFGSPEDATVSPEPLESCSLALWGARTTKRNPRRKQRTL